MKLTNKKKGFTIVELVIVIAVIAILAAVLIPNLSRLVTKANESAAMQEAKAAMDNDLINANGDLANMEEYEKIGDKQYFVVSSHKGDTEKDLVETEYTLSNKTFTKVTKSSESGATNKQVENTMYYVLEAYKGTYDKSANGGTYTYETNKYTCTFANGEWVVEEKN